jgi:hypothetical protein
LNAEALELAAVGVADVVQSLGRLLRGRIMRVLKRLKAILGR